MDINAKPLWKPGMRLTTRLLESQTAYTERLLGLVQQSYGHMYCGLLPDSPFECHAVFTGHSLVIERLRCLLMLASGHHLDIDQRVEVRLPSIDNGEFYLVADKSDETVEFEAEGMTYTRPVYKFSIYTLDEALESNAQPLVHFICTDRTAQIDNKYIVPCLLCSSSPRMLQRITAIGKKAKELSQHPNLNVPGIVSTIGMHAYTISNINPQTSSYEAYYSISALLQLINSQIYRTTGIKPTPVIPALYHLDPAQYFDIVDLALETCNDALDKWQPEEVKIDLEALKAEIKGDLRNELKTELREELKTELREELREELMRELSEQMQQKLDERIETTRSELEQTLHDRLHSALHDTLHDQLSEELRSTLYDTLYQSLYDALYAALFVPEQEETDNFMPDI